MDILTHMIGYGPVIGVIIVKERIMLLKLTQKNFKTVLYRSVIENNNASNGYIRDVRLKSATWPTKEQKGRTEGNNPAYQKALILQDMVEKQRQEK